MQNTDPLNQKRTSRLRFDFRDSLAFRLAIVGILALLLLIPTSMIKSLIREREYTRDGAISEVSAKWGDPQTVTGPILSIPYKTFTKNDQGKVQTYTQYAHFLPTELKINGKIAPEMRKRSIYEVVVYTAALEISGSFTFTGFADWNINPQHVIWNDAQILLGITDMRGIRENVTLNWNNEQLSFNPGLPTSDVIGSGISTPITNLETGGVYNFSLSLDLNGSKNLFFYPLGEQTLVDITSAWTEPSFTGAFLPRDHKINESGFVANWQVLHLNRNYPQKWRSSSHEIYNSSFGVNLLVPVDHYRKSHRSIQYAIMLIALTFVSFFFIEVLNKLKVHPVQYILVGLALVLFYTLLLSISEHLNFDAAFLIAMVATIAMIGLYAKTIFKNLRLTVLLTGILFIMYGFIYIILQLQDFALLIGSIGLFVVLGFIMYVSRKINWYSMVEENE